MIRTLLPHQVMTQVAATVLLVGGVSLLVWTLLDGSGVSWWPTTWSHAPFSDLVPQVLRP